MNELQDDQLVSECRSRVAGLGYELVDMRRRGSASRPMLQVRIDRPDAAPGRGITVNECGDVSRALEAWLDQSGVLGPRYVLEVSSPGIERPIRWREHWQRYVGHEVKVRLPGVGRVQATIVQVLAGRDAVEFELHERSERIVVDLEDARDATLIVDWSAIERSASRDEQ